MTNLLNALKIDERQAKEIIELGIDNVSLNGVIYNKDIYNFYNEHEERINEIIKIEVGVTVWEAMKNIQAFETLINNIGGVDSELEFGDCAKLEQSELPYIVWYAIEVECI